MDFLIINVLSIISLIIVVYILICYFLSRMLLHLDKQPIPKTPKDYGMDFQSADFNSSDGVKLKGWLIPAPQTS